MSLRQNNMQLILEGMDTDIMSEELFSKFVKKHGWRFAKTMPQCPHWYVVRDEHNWDEFGDAVNFIRRYGFDCRWKNGPKRKYLDYGEYYYWTMGNPVDETTIINRCLKTDYYIDNGRMFVNAKQLF